MPRSTKYQCFYLVAGVTYKGGQVYEHPQLGGAYECGDPPYERLVQLPGNRYLFTAKPAEDAAWAEQCAGERARLVEEANPSLAGR